jgi:hypothetical protein
MIELNDITQRRLAAARERMSQAKARYGLACAAVLRADPDAPSMATTALRELEAAQAELRGIA